jgi:DNA processing protein
VGPATFRALVNQFGGAEAAIDALPVLSRRGGAHGIRLCSEAEAEAELEAAESLDAHLVAIGEPGYPPALAQVDAPPPLLFVKGRLDLADIPVVAIVGARNGSAVGQKFTRALATDLGLEGFVIASGLARGIDTAAHVAALERGTVAVLAGGIDIVYPPENEELQRDEAKSPEPLPDIRQNEREMVVGALGFSPVDIDELIRATGLETRKVHIVLLELDLAGRLQRHGQQLVSLIES